MSMMSCGRILTCRPLRQRLVCLLGLPPYQPIHIADREKGPLFSPGVPNRAQHVAQRPAVVLLLAATILEVSGDAVVRTAIFNHMGLARIGLFLAGAALLLSYGTLLNLAPFEFGQLVGLYLATLFVVWQLVNFVAFRTLPTLPIVLGGSLVIAGGAIITFWKPG
jgi:hypothetical protein